MIILQFCQQCLEVQQQVLSGVYVAIQLIHARSVSVFEQAINNNVCNHFNRRREFKALALPIPYLELIIRLEVYFVMRALEVFTVESGQLWLAESLLLVYILLLMRQRLYHFILYEIITLCRCPNNI
jgi:hypothetical protein